MYFFHPKAYISPKHSFKVIASWISIVYTVLYIIAAIIPASRGFVLQYIGAGNSFNSGFIGIQFYIYGLIIWNIIGILATWLFTSLNNHIR